MMIRIGNKTISIIEILLIMIIPVIAISVGFSALSTSVSINGLAKIIPIDYIVVMSNEPDQSTNINNLSYSHTIDSITISANLENLNDQVIYNVNIRNLGQTNKQLSEIIEDIFSNSDMKYTLNGLAIGDVIVPSQSVDFQVIFDYKNNVAGVTDPRLNASLKFVFDDYELPPVSIGYFKPYNGNLNIFGMDKTGITGFKRNTTLTETQVRAIPGVQSIKNVSNDQYNSQAEVLGWIDSNNVFNWWSNAETVYFHPDTIQAFRNFDAITSVDFTGTNTSKVKNFAHFFDKDRVLVSIIGKIDTSGLVLVDTPFDFANDADENASSEEGVAFMFNDCNALRNLDVSLIDTTNAVDMKRMFGGCKALPNIDISHFNTSNARSMYWLFRYANEMTSIDLSSFDTGNVESMVGMFISSPKLKTITFGDNFDTSKVTKFNRMFDGDSSLTTIYAKMDFIRLNSSTSNEMFKGCTKLVGAADKPYATAFSSSHTDKAYAQIASNAQNGYFTSTTPYQRYTIMYELDGGTHNNPVYYTEDSTPFNLSYPVKSGYHFIGWTGSNGNTIEKDVTVPIGTSGNLTYTAHYEANTYTVVFNANGGTGSMESQEFVYDVSEALDSNTFTRQDYAFVSWNTKADGTGSSYLDNQTVLKLTPSGSITLYAQWRDASDPFPEVFRINGTCEFHGSSQNITGTGCSMYNNVKYINTGLSLYDSNNKNKDFEISFTIDSYESTQTETQATIFNMKYENASANYPGFVLRRNNTQLELTSKFGSTKKAVNLTHTNGDHYRIVRKDKKIYYSINGSAFSLLQDGSSYNGSFNTPLTFGASLTDANAPMRFIRMTLSDISVKVGTMSSLQ